MIGTKLGPYEIRAEIGKGGMAMVYRAYHPAADRDVAIKVIDKEIADEASALKRFRREARLIAHLEHINILPIYDVDVAHQIPYIVMRLVEGGTLKNRLEQGSLTLPQINRFLHQIAAALDFAHANGVIHRDIKPSNILIDRSGDAFVADFGIARLLDQQELTSTVTQADSTVGTPAYMAPEQGLGANLLTPQADIYSLGIIFFEMVTGQMPYQADGKMGLILKHINDPIPSASELNPGLPRAIDDVIACAMAKNPTERFGSATEFVDSAMDNLRQSVRPSSGAAEPATLSQAEFAVDLAAKTVLGTEVIAGLKTPSDMHLAISMLGSVQVALNGQPITSFDYDKVRALLIFLVLERDSVHRREALAELLWPDQTGKKGRDSLRAALSTLRKAVKDQKAIPRFLLTETETLQFNSTSHFTVDTDQFMEVFAACSKHRHARIETCAECVQRLEQAIDLYRGRFAQDLALPDADDFDNWLNLYREKFQATVLDALIIAANYYEQLGDYAVARRYAWRQIELEPWREEAYRQLMRLLALGGQRTAALVQYARCCRVLEEELAVSPSRETVALYEQIRDAAVGSVSGRPGANLPAPSTSFLGRDREIGQLLDYLANPGCRVITIIGLGGMGKTRLAIETARQATATFQNVYFVPLDALNTSDLIPSAIADVLQFSTVNQDSFATELIHYLSAKNLLLVLDNVEHLEDGWTLFAEIVESAPDVKLLLTSHEKLNLPGEWVLPLNGLMVASTSGQTEQSATDLFIQRARMVQPAFVSSATVVPDILRICQLVNGMPLGIELAAAWMQMLSCREIADGISSNIAFLDSSRRDLPERHQSLRAVFEHSWTLLSQEQQRAFGALAVFRGGFQADAALEIAGAALPTLLALISKSMLHRNADGRYEIHELLRQYSLEKLRNSDIQAVSSRHLEFYANLAETAEPLLRGEQQIPWLERLEAEKDNLRAALDWSLANHAEDTGLRLAASLWFFWHVRNYFHEGLTWLKKLLIAATSAPALVRAKALFAAGWMAQNNRDLAQAAELSQASYELAQQVGDKQSLAYPLSTLAWLDYFQANYPRALMLGEQALALFRTVKDSWGIVHCLNILGYIAESQADYLHAEGYQREGINVARTAGDNDSLGWSLYLLGRIMAERNQDDEAVRFCTESLSIYREMHNSFGIAMSLYTLSTSALGLGNYSQAVDLATESVNLLREMADDWAIGGPLSCLGMIAYRQGDLAKAADYSQQSLAYFRQVGDKRGMAYALNTLGCVAQQRDRFKDAADLFKQSLVLRREVGIPRGIEVCFDHLAEIAAVLGDYEDSTRLLAAAEALRAQMDALRSGEDRMRHAAYVELAHHQLGDASFEAAWHEGTVMSLEDAILCAINSA